MRTLKKITAILVFSALTLFLSLNTYAFTSKDVNKQIRTAQSLYFKDTSRSALRHRVTRFVSSQVAGKMNGVTTLYTIHIAKDRRTDGSWDELHGHIMFEDPILEKNVQK